MNRKEQARAIWKSIAEKVPALEDDTNRLELLLDVTQNDGSLDEDTWTRLRDVKFGLKTFLAAMRG